MNTKGIRIEVPIDLHNLLCDEQQKRKSITGKISPLADIVLEYFTTGLQAGLLGLNHDSEYNSATSESSTLQVQKRTIELSEKGKQVEATESKLKVWENNLGNSENKLREREQKLIENYNEFYEKKADFANEREKS
ncbi:MAG: hypothetical protein WCQ95_00340 [Bacteroidota bacterium]